ncbi:MAG: DUF1461 domain-containing protein [Candidatus Woesearchaeota archaeon]
MVKRRLVLTLLVISTVYLIVCINLFLVMFNLGLYQQEFEKLHTYEKIANADAVALDMIKYLKSESAIITSGAFTKNEVDHLRDVRIIVQRLQILSVIMLLIWGGVVFRRNFKILASAMVYSGIFLVMLIAALFLMANNFEWLFVKFHLIFFPQGNWMFSNESSLIRLFPKQFFVDMFTNILLRVLVCSVILFVAGNVILSEKIKMFIKKSKNI